MEPRAKRASECPLPWGEDAAYPRQVSPVVRAGARAAKDAARRKLGARDPSSASVATVPKLSTGPGAVEGTCPSRGGHIAESLREVTERRRSAMWEAARFQRSAARGRRKMVHPEEWPGALACLAIPLVAEHCGVRMPMPVGEGAWGMLPPGWMSKTIAAEPRSAERPSGCEVARGVCERSEAGFGAPGGMAWRTGVLGDSSSGSSLGGGIGS